MAIEVKHSKQIGNHDLKGLEEFLKDYPMAKAILLYCGSERFMIRNVLCMPCEEFLRSLRPNKDLIF